MDIKKTFRLNLEEEQQLLHEMTLQGETNFSNFIRKKLLHQPPATDLSLLAENFYKIHQASQLENINERLYRIQVLAEATNQVDAYKMEQVMACFRDLLHEAERTLPLSGDFKEKWL